MMSNLLSYVACVRWLFHRSVIHPFVLSFIRSSKSIANSDVIPIVQNSLARTDERAFGKRCFRVSIEPMAYHSSRKPFIFSRVSKPAIATTMTRSSACSPGSTENSPLLLQPILYGGREASDQYIGGGLPSGGPGSGSPTSSKESCCAICGESTPSLARFRTHPTTAAVSGGGGGAPALKNQQRMLHVMACTKASCWNALFADLEGGNVSLGGKGVLSCMLSVAVDVDVDVVATAATATNTNASTAAATIVSTNDEWGNTGGEANKSAVETHDMDSLEAQLAAIEQAEGGFSSSNGSKISTPKPGAAIISQSTPPPMPTPILGEELEQPPTPPRPDQSWSTTPTTVFPRYELYAVKEPNAPRSNNNNSNSTAANPNRMSSSSSRHGKDSAKIQAMLDRYLADETDETIRSALAAAAGHTNGRGGGDNDDFCLGGDEEEEEDDEDEDKTPTADKILRDYKERLQRVPRQVIRCGGTPLWSVYVVSYLLHCRPICDLAWGN
jgi:hypothetical protein